MNNEISDFLIESSIMLFPSFDQSKKDYEKQSKKTRIFTIQKKRKSN
jgi:hypothetical protein